MKVTATVERDGRFWLVHVPEVDRWTQARSLAEVPEMAADLAALMADVEPESVEVAEIAVKLPGDVQAHLDHAAKLREEAAHAQHEAAREAREAAQGLRRHGMTVRDVGAALGVSHQRAQQLLQSA